MGSLKGIVNVAIVLALFSTLSSACSINRDKRHLSSGLPIPTNKAGECVKSELSKRKVCYPSFEQLDDSCMRRAASSPLPIIQNARVKSMTFLPASQYARMVAQSFHRRGMTTPRDVRLPSKPFIYVNFECLPSYQLLDEAQSLFCMRGHWTGTLPVCVKKAD
uniref:Sushi domain-containing protein n=1 Tax=Plectus sambesii TaxID=2011161 RepID=A0A914V5M4_9BILA